MFQGENPHAWIFRVDCYFTINQLKEAEQLTAAAICLDEDALAWFHWADNRRQ